MPGMLRIGLTGSPPRAQFSRDPEVPDELWNALGRNIDPDTRQLDDRHVSVPVERLLARRRWLAEALRTYGCGFDASQAISALLERHDAELDEIGHALAQEPAPIATDGLMDGSRFHRPLREFQARDLGRLLALSHGANFSVPGAGKTTVAYALYEAERQRRAIRRLLVVAPLSAFDAWEPRRWSASIRSPWCGTSCGVHPRAARFCSSTTRSSERRATCTLPSGSRKRRAM